MSKHDHKNEKEEEEEECFYESLDRILSSTTCSSSSSSDNEEKKEEEEYDDDNDRIVGDRNCGCVGDCVCDDAFARPIPIPKFPLGIANDYEVWISRPSSVDERRMRLLRRMGLSHRRKPPSSTAVVKFGKYVDQLGHPACSSSISISSNNTGIIRSKSADHEHCNSSCNNLDSYREILSIRSFSSPVSNNVDNVNGASPNKPPVGGVIKRGEEIVNCDDSTHLDLDVGNNGDDAVCTIKNLDNGKEFVVGEVREDGMWGKLKEVGTGRHLTMEEFEMCVGRSPIVQELMRRQNVEEAGNKDSPDTNSGGGNGNGSKSKQKGGWLKSIKNVASSVTGSKERRSSDERDTSSEKGGRRSSSATDDSQDVSFHGPERVRVRQYGKSCKDLTALYKSQEIQAHNGSIWTIKFSLDGKYLASAGEDCLIHVWQVVSSDRKGDLLFDKQEDVNLNVLLLSNGSPEAALASPNSQREKKRRGRLSISRKSTSLDQIVVPETMFALSEKPVCSFKGHLDDVLDLSWSKSQDLLSSSMDKTVRLWQLSSKSCLKIFSHNDYGKKIKRNNKSVFVLHLDALLYVLTCIQFNPVDDRYFISGSLDAKVRIWSIPDRQVVDWNDMHEMVTAACYTPDGQQKSQINLQNKKKSRHKKITGFQFAPGIMSEVLITSADSRIRVVDGLDLVHKFKGFRNTNRQISASVTANGRYVVCASEDSQVYVWKHEGDSRPSQNKGVTVTRSYEHFHCQDVSVAIPWPGMTDDAFHDRRSGDHSDDVSAANHPTTPEDEMNSGSFPITTTSNNPFHGIISSASNGYFFDRFSATWPEEKLVSATKSHSQQMSSEFMNGVGPIKSAWGMVIVTAGLRGEIRTFQNFGLPGKANASLKDSSLFGASFSSHLKVDLKSSLSRNMTEFSRRGALKIQAVTTTTPSVNQASTDAKKTLRKGTVVITGASSGLGLATAKALAETGKWHVIMACRDFLKAERSAKSVGMPKENYTVMHLDLASFDSVRQFVANFKQSGQPLDVLVCNAAVYFPTAKEPTYTADGFELSVGTNHLGHFLLARLLLDDLKQSDYPSKRLIIVGSITGNTNTLAGNVPPKANLGDMRGLAGGLNGLNSSAMIDGGDFDGAKAYKDSKVCNMLMMQEFHRRYHEETGITFASLYPGCIATTGLFREHIPLFRLLFPPFQKFITKGYVSEEESGKRLAQVVSDPSLTKSGVYWSWNNNSASFENQLSEEASDVTKARKVWEISEKLVGNNGDDAVCTIKNLDNGKEFVVGEVREDQRMAKSGNKDSPNTKSGGNGSKLKQKGGWLKSIKNVASSVTGSKEKRSSNERDTSSEKGGRRSSSAIDDSHDVLFHGPERICVRQYGKSCKDLTALYKIQEIQIHAHNGLIWTLSSSWMESILLVLVRTV
ncbi:hypothetical protein OSB04_003981 [Centaurea solstitialis]|uniref:NADPH-protochlorophyllide oxidoreductase n=1 Tax=Centaurea solstitialis TaxID=347529 RepID=A0AA38U7N4_9ASTR|nr:hypothetical protein OSB04_003981 [Centaurea solstitialis]